MITRGRDCKVESQPQSVAPWDTGILIADLRNRFRPA